MRDYSKVSGEFWTGKTGKSLRGDMQTQLIAMYLMTSRHSNMIGVFHCPILYMAHETGSPIEGATKSLDKLIEGGFCTYDDDSETVWVHEMARFQIGDSLSPGDNQVKGIQKQFDGLPESRIKTGFYEKYAKAFHIQKDKPLTSPLEAPSKPETETGTGTETRTGTGKKKSSQPDKPSDVSGKVWSDYLQIRKAKRAPITETALAQIRREAGKAGIDLQTALEHCCTRGWQSFKAEWIKDQNPRASPNQVPETAYQRSMREIASELAPGIAKKAPNQTLTTVESTSEVSNVVAIRCS